MNAEMTCGGCADPANHPHAIDCNAEARMAELSAQLRAGQITYDEWDAAVNLPNRLRRRAAMERADWVPTFSRWRHGGWYVDNIVFPSGAVGCIASPTAERKTFVSACFVDAYEGRKTRVGAALAERAEAIRQWEIWDIEQAAAQVERSAAPASLTAAETAAGPLVPVTAARVADDAMRGFTITDGDVEECSAEFIREQIEEAVEAAWAHRAAEAEAAAAEPETTGDAEEVAAETPTPEQIARTVANGYHPDVSRTAYSAAMEALAAWQRIPANDGSLHAATAAALRERAENFADDDDSEGYDFTEARLAAAQWVEDEPDAFWERYAGPMLDEIEKEER